MDAKERDALILAAKEALLGAYAPYSKFRVGAAVLDDRGAITKGANVENASYPAGCCAERVAMYAAIASGARSIKGVAVTLEADGLPKPCGVCRQVMAEFASDDFELLAVHASGAVESFDLEGLLPHAFGPKDLV